MSLNRLTCTPLQSSRLLGLGIIPWAFIWHYRENAGDQFETILLKYPEPGENVLPAWTFAELCALIGPRWKKPDLWAEDQQPKAATDPNTFPLFFPDRVVVYENAAEAAAHGLTFLLENEYLTPGECNDRYHAIFKPGT